MNIETMKNDGLKDTWKKRKFSKNIEILQNMFAKNFFLENVKFLYRNMKFPKVFWNLE